MDRITRKLIEELIASYELISRGIAKDFELYVNHCIVSDYVDGLFDIENVTVGNGNDTCLDGLAIIVNGQVIENQEQIERLVEERIKIDVKYIFIQSKSGEKFEKKYINEFGTGVNDFFDVNPKLPRNNDIKRIASISDLIIENPRLLKRNPDCKLFYVTSGIKQDNDINHNAIISMHRESLESTNLFKDVSFELLGAREIRELFRRSINPIIAEFEFSNRIILHEHLPGIKEAHFGALPLDQFLNILLDKNGNQKPVFEDNVRDFQGASNAVNQKISETLMSESPELFTVLNNGITIVASSVKITGSRFVLEDYQIVNGCQTSNMIYDALESLKDSSIQIPIKLIITEDENIKNQITIATNSQIAVKREQLHVMTKFQKDLEQFYLASQEEELYSNDKITKVLGMSLY